MQSTIKEPMNMGETLDKSELRKFGLVIGGFVALLFGLLFPLIFTRSIPVWPWIFMAVFWCWAIVIPATIEPVYKVWMVIGNKLGWINTRIILGIVFYLVVLPIGLVMKLFGKDAMRQKFNTNESYRVKSESQTKDHLERPF